MSRRIGPRATAMIQHFEGLRLEAYRCAAGKWTIGWGNTYYQDGRPVRPGDRISRADAEALFGIVVRHFEAGVDRLLGGAATSAGQFGALVSLGFNLGLGRVGDPHRRGLAHTRALALHVSGDHAAAASAFGRLSYGGGQRLFGLVRRRAVEAALYRGQFALFDEALELYRGGRMAAADRLLAVRR